MMRYWTLIATCLLMISWTDSASAERWENDQCHVQSNTSVMVLKTWAANCLTLEEDYPRVRMERDQWRLKYDDAELQVSKLLDDRDRLIVEVDVLDRRTLELSDQVQHWRDESEEKFSSLEMIGIGSVGFTLGGVVGILIWAFVVPSL